MKKITLSLLLFPLLLSAQEGINFQHGLSWQEVQAKAKAEHKFIFMDCFTTWCGPCKYMSTTIFPQKAVGDDINAKFISVKMQLDTTGGDNEEVKSWYQTGHDIADEYKVRAYPTYLFFDPNGKLVHRVVGSTQTPEDFIAKADDALDPSTQYYTLLDKYKAGDKDSAFLHKMALAAEDAYELKTAAGIANEYLATQKDLYTKDNLDFISRFTQTSKDKGFDIMLNNADKVDAVMGKGTAENIVQNIILREDVYPVIFAAQVKSAKDLPEPNWDSLQSIIKAKYPAKADEVMAYSKVVFYMEKSDWSNFAPAVVSYMRSYGDNASDEQLNSFAWTVFQNCDDMTCVAEALDWSKKSFEGNNNPAFMDTYANILYKMGKKDEAIQWETKAASLANGDKTYQDTLDKMKNGEKTWN